MCKLTHSHIYRNMNSCPRIISSGLPIRCLTTPVTPPLSPRRLIAYSAPHVNLPDDYRGVVLISHGTCTSNSVHVTMNPPRFVIDGRQNFRNHAWSYPDPTPGKVSSLAVSITILTPNIPQLRNVDNTDVTFTVQVYTRRFANSDDQTFVGEDVNGQSALTHITVPQSKLLPGTILEFRTTSLNYRLDTGDRVALACSVNQGKCAQNLLVSFSGGMTVSHF